MPVESPLRVVRLSELDFKTMADGWQECLSASDSHPLFMGWPWLYSWWETWSQILELELLLLGVFDESGQLVGIGPFFLKDLVSPVGFRVRRLHLIGNAWHIAPTVRTEYCSVILCNDQAAAARNALMRAIADYSWDEWVLCDGMDSELKETKKSLTENGVEVRWVSREQDEGVRIDTTGNFKNWLEALGRNTRLKAYNRRDYLRKCGEFELLYCSEAEFDEFLKKLNNFHVLRWGKPAFDDEAVRFHKLFAARLPASGGQVLCSLLQFNGDCISVLYDVATGGQRINLQSGYYENFDRRVSLGPLHLGFAIEGGFKDPETNYYDLLAGGGKHSYYKSHFRGERVEFQTVQLVSRPLLRFIYRVQGGMPDELRGFLNRWFRL